MTISTERLSLLLVLLLLGTLGTSRGAMNGGFYKSAVPPQRPLSVLALRPSFEERSSEWALLRGGETSIPEENEESSGGGGLVVAKLRNVIRSILRLGDDKLPVVSGILRTCFKTIEGLTGLSLLPAPAKKSSQKKGSKSKTKSKTKKPIDADDEAGTSEKDGATTPTTTTTKNSSKKKSRQNKKKKVSAAAQKHLSSNIKSTNPNYRIQKELKAFLKSPPDNLSVSVGSNIRLWIVTIKGAKGSIYDGETFKLRIEFPKEYPTVPPSVYFLQKFIPLHEHVYTNGDICLSLLGKGWRPTMSAQSIAVSIYSILSSAPKKCLPMDNAVHAGNKPGQYQKDWVYHDDNC